MNVPGGVPQRELTIAACQRACVQTMYCVGVDIDPDPSTAFCWLSVPPMAGGPIQAFVGVTHYALARNPGCPFAGEQTRLPLLLGSGVVRTACQGRDNAT